MKTLEINKPLSRYNALKHEKALYERNNIFNEAREEVHNLSKRELYLVGIALYWAEGYKTDKARGLEFANSDPKMIKLMMKWFREICNVSDDKFRIRLQLHNPEKVKTATEFWVLNTGISPSQFTKPYIKTSPTSKGRSGNLLVYGICHIRIADTKLLAKIKGWISGLGGPIV